MKKGLVLLVCGLFQVTLSYCQLTDGSTAPDFTFTDINGNTQNLYSYLNAGKYVAMEISATWCHPCWDYHETGVLDSLYNLHDMPGDQTWKVLFMEGDGNTTLADLQGTGTNTQGNWVGGSQYPIMNPSGVLLNDFISNYNNNFFPTLYIICPDKKVYQDTLNKGTKPSVSRWEYVAAIMCGSAGVDEIKDINPVTIYPNPAKDYTVLYISLNGSTELNMVITNVLGQKVAAKNLGVLPAGNHSITYDVSNLTEGIYLFTLSDGKQTTYRKLYIR
jgi:hypothetical protein